MSDEYTVVLENRDDMRAWSEIEPVLKEFAELLRMGIYVSNPHRCSIEPQTEPDKLFIRFWSIPGPKLEEKPSTHIEEAFGIHLANSQRDAVHPSGEGIPIIDPSGTTVAELVGGTLYVLFDLPHYQNANADTLMRAIMEQALSLLKSSEERDRLLREMAGRERERSRELYIQECSCRIEDSVRTAEWEISHAEEQIAEATHEIVVATRKMESSRHRLRWLQNFEEEHKERFGREFDRLLKIPGVTRVRVTEGKVSVFTDEIVVEYEGERYHLGRYRIDIFTSGEKDGVRVFNLSGNTPDGKQHPHVYEDGNCCLGNAHEGIAKLIGTYEYSVVAQMMLEFLRNSDPDGGYISVTEWPREGDETEEGGEG